MVLLRKGVLTMPILPSAITIVALLDVIWMSPKQCMTYRHKATIMLLWWKFIRLSATLLCLAVDICCTKLACGPWKASQTIHPFDKLQLQSSFLPRTLQCEGSISNETRIITKHSHITCHSRFQLRLSCLLAANDCSEGPWGWLNCVPLLLCEARLIMAPLVYLFIQRPSWSAFTKLMWKLDYAWSLFRVSIFQKKAIFNENLHCCHGLP